MLVEGLLVGLVLFIAKFTDWVGCWQLSRPIAIAPLVGLVLGHPVEGIMLGAVLELVFLGIIAIGGSVPQDITVGAVFGAAYAILLGKGPEVAITLSVPISMLAVLFYNILKLIITGMVAMFDKYLEEGADGKYSMLFLTIGVVQPLCYGLLGFLGIVLGTTAVEVFIQSIPSVVMASLIVAAGILPALGFAMLLKALWNKHIGLFFFLGFAIAAYLKLPIIAIAIFATCIAVYICLSEYSLNSKVKGGEHAAVQQTGLDKEDFFNV